MTEVLQDVSRQAVLEANAANMRGAFSSFAICPRAEVYDGVDLLQTITDIPFPMFNSVLDARLEPERVQAAIEKAKARCASHGVPMRWNVAPTDKPADIGQYLEAGGFVHDGDLTLMALDLLALKEESRPFPDLVIESATDVGERTQWSKPMVIGFGIPLTVVPGFEDYCRRLGQELALGRFELSTGWRNRKPVATAALFLAGGVAGVYCIATLPEARGQGIGTAMTRAACARARELGYRVAVLHASEMGFGIYQKIGFRAYGRIGLYSWMPQPGRGGAAISAD